LDHLLIAVGTSHDEEAFTVLFDHLRPRVQAQMVRLGLATIAAEDVTQDVMETIWRKRICTIRKNRRRSPGSFRSPAIVAST